MDSLNSTSSPTEAPPVGTEDAPPEPATAQAAQPSRSAGSKRYRLRAEVTLEKAGQLPVEADLHEISSTGMFVATASTFPAGTPLDFVVRPLQLTAEPVSGRLAVVWRRQLSAGPGRPAGIGCSFQSFQDDGEKLLEEWIECNPHLEIGRSAPDRSSLTRELSRFAAEMHVQEISNTWDASEIRSGSARQAMFPGWITWSLVAIGLLVAALLASIWLMPTPAPVADAPATVERSPTPGVPSLSEVEPAPGPVGASAPADVATPEKAADTPPQVP